MDEEEWKQANPGLGDILDLDELRTAATRAKTGGFKESEFRIKRLNQWVSSSTVALPGGMFEKLSVQSRIKNFDPGEMDDEEAKEAKAELAAKLVKPEDEPRVIFFDGSFSHDCTALVECFLDGYIQVLGCWEKDMDDDSWRVPMGEVENAVFTRVRDTNVIEVAADPFRWAKELEDWRANDIPVLEFPTSSPSRMVPAWAAFYDAVLSSELMHDGDPRLERHVRNMVLKIDRLGPRPVKEHKGSFRSIDLGICAVGGYVRAMWHAANNVELEPLIEHGD
jgi:phage terminase large subunit-like protein